MRTVVRAVIVHFIMFKTHCCSYIYEKKRVVVLLLLKNNSKSLHRARTTGKPMLGICLGFQCMVIEFCRYVYNDCYSNKLTDV